ncbi:MAG: SusC/RagA family TonB-linked outer membrane protein, partial [Bacteroidales bacterium]|nr:SusC/RagA family TonB-linked outer membrane protein [Bacteroidales bacterium]
MMKHLFFKFLLFLSVYLGTFLAGYAQGGNVTGRVTDASDGSMLPGVTVVIKGTTMGTITDLNGSYRIRIESASTTLVFSFIGFETQEFIAQPGQVVDVALITKSTVLQELVVIGYGVQKKEDATGSISAVSAKDFNKGAIINPTELMAGKIAGVQIINGGGEPGGGTTIRIRSGSSLRASNDPLILIDGVPMDNEGVSGARNPLSMLNPNDIETFTVLKDASATAIYGSRASNGVIMITTKKGEKGSKLKLNYTGTFSLYTVPKMLDVLDATEYKTLLNQRYPENQTVLSMLGNDETDWQKEIYKDAFGMDHYISASGTVDLLPYRISLGYSDQDGILKTDNMKRTTVSASLNPSLFDDHLKIDFNMSAMFIKNHFADQGAIGAAIQYDPTKPITSDSVYTVHYNDKDGNPQTITTDYGGYYAWTQTVTGAPVSQGSSNPVALLELRDDESYVNRLVGSIQLDYKFHFLPDLRANLNLGYDHSLSDGNVYVPDYAPWSFDPVNGGGISTTYDQEKKNEVLDFYLNYVKDVPSARSAFNIMAGYSWQHYWRRGSNYSTNLKGTVVTDDSDYETENYLVSFFGRFNYTLMDRYLVTFTLRDDGTSRFSPDTRWGLFPSVALAWKIVDEPWMQNANILSQLKLRAGWGITGQQNINQGDYPYLPRYTYSQMNAAYLFGSTYWQTLRPEGYDINIKWEETTTWNLGLDYGFARDKFYGSLDFYYRLTADLINFIPVPAGSNLTNYILTNIGDMDNKGVEFSINTRPVAKKDLFWEINLNATYQTSEITKLTATDDPNYLGVPTGGISGGVGNNIQIHSVGYTPNTFYVLK